MTDRQATLGDSHNEPEDWVDVYCHGSPKEGYLIVIPDKELRKEIPSETETETGYESQVQSILKAISYGNDYTENALRVYNIDESAVTSAQRGRSSSPTANKELFKQIWERARNHPSRVRFELTDYPRKEMLAL